MIQESKVHTDIVMFDELQDSCSTDVVKAAIMYMMPCAVISLYNMHIRPRNQFTQISSLGNDNLL
jgi:hypothetical protein